MARPPARDGATILAQLADMADLPHGDASQARRFELLSTLLPQPRDAVHAIVACQPRKAADMFSPAAPLPTAAADLAIDAVQAALTRAASDRWNCIRTVHTDRALAQARRIDDTSAGLAPLAGLPYAVKDMFDVAGLPTLAGGPAHARLPAAARDARIVRRMAQAGAVLVASTAMDEYAYGFTGANPHHGAVANPRDRGVPSGGSSSGSAAAVAAGIVRLAIGSDTNGSVRVPAALCGVYGLKPTFGRFSRIGSQPFVKSLDHVGLLAASLAELGRVYEALAPPEGTGSAAPPRLVLGTGDYQALCNPEALPDRRALPFDGTVELFHVAEALAASSLITSVEAAQAHRAGLRAMPERYSAAVAARLRAGLAIPREDYLRARRHQRAFRVQMAQLLLACGVLIVPALPMAPPPVGAEFVEIRGRRWWTPDALGLFTRPFSLAGCPALVLPAGGGQPALQLVAAPGREAALLRAAAHVEAARASPGLGYNRRT